MSAFRSSSADLPMAPIQLALGQAGEPMGLYISILTVVNHHILQLVIRKKYRYPEKSQYYVTK
jgi:hypothetical protein